MIPNKWKMSKRTKGCNVVVLMIIISIIDDDTVL